MQKGIALLALLMLTGSWGTGEASAQQQAFISKWMDVGELWHLYSQRGARFAGAGGMYPAIQVKPNSLHGNHDGDHKWIAIKNYTDVNGDTYSHYIAYIASEAQNQQYFSQEFKMVSKFPRPEVTVDGLPSRLVRSRINEVDPEMNADRMIVNELRTVAGINLRREVRAFSQEYHDNYHIIEYTLTNTGNVDGDEEVELPNQSVDSLYFVADKRWGATRMAGDVSARGATWGKFLMHDMVRDGDFRAQWSWNGYAKGTANWDPMGAPAINGGGGAFPVDNDTIGRLVGYQFMGREVLFAEGQAGSGKDDPNQPGTMTFYDAESPIFGNTCCYQPTNVKNNQIKFEELIEVGITDPYHAEIVEPSGDYAHSQADPTLSAAAGFKVHNTYGPYSLEPGESVKIVEVEAVDGLSHEAAVEIGRAYKSIWQQGKDDYTDIEYDANGNGTIENGEVMDKNEWYITGKDSLFQTFRRAQAAYDEGYDIPTGPKPPRTFHVQGDAGGIQLEWELFENADPAAFEIYRGQDQYQGELEEGFIYNKIATIEDPSEVCSGGTCTYLDDENVERGVDYFYYMQVVGEPNTDGTGMTPTGVTLKSGRYYTQTYTPARLKEDAGTLETVEVVPNPYKLSASDEVGYAGAERIGFLDVPGQATIEIYTERGDLVTTIEHTDNSGDAFWDLSSSAEQLVASGVYIAVVTNTETGGSTIKKFVIIR